MLVSFSLREKSFPSAVQNGFEWAGAQYNALSQGAQKRWQQVVAAGNAVKERGSKLLTAAGDRFNKLKAGATEFVIKNFLKPIEPFIKPVQETFVKIGTSISENLNKIPGYKYVTEFLGKRGITVANALTSASKFAIVPQQLYLLLVVLPTLFLLMIRQQMVMLLVQLLKVLLVF